jgi:hypothetical protein
MERNRKINQADLHPDDQGEACQKMGMFIIGCWRNEGVRIRKEMLEEKATNWDKTGD